MTPSRAPRTPKPAPTRAPKAKAPAMSLVVLTLDEEANIGDCLASLARQTDQRFEVILIDAASRDRTLEIARKAAKGFPVPLRIEAMPDRIPIGKARNLGVRLAKAPVVAFLSADAEADPDWVRRALAALDGGADMVFGRQLHVPRQWTVGAAVRGLRYHFPAAASDDALRFASNVAAAYRKPILLANPFDDWTNAAEDLLLARRAVSQGATARYDPELLVHHHDVHAARAEWRKNLREGRGMATYRGELGYMPELLLWGTAMLAAATLTLLRPGWATAGLLALTLWAPALRRSVRRVRAGIPAHALALGVAASPAFDLAFLASYLRGLADRQPPLQETRP